MYTGKPIPQDTGTRSGHLQEIILPFSQEVSPQEYKFQLERLIENDQNGSGFEQVRLDTCERVYAFGDVHARGVDVAKALAEIDAGCQKRGTTLDGELSEGKIAILFVGDLVHSEKNVGNYWKAESADDRKKLAEENLNSIIGILSLRRSYPKSVLVVQGNHDHNATFSGVAKMGVDQGELLGEILSKYDLHIPLQTLLNSLPLMVGLHIGDRHILMTHAFPLPFGSYSEIIQYIDGLKRPFVGDQSMSDFIKGIWGNDKDVAIRNIKNRVDEISRLILWGKIQSPKSGVGSILPIGTEMSIPEDVLNSRGQEFMQDYIYLLMKFLLSTSKDGEKIKPSDILWIIGHEQTFQGIRKVSDVLDSPRLKKKGVNIIQINSYSKLPVLGMNVTKWGDESFVSQDNLKLY